MQVNMECHKDDAEFFFLGYKKDSKVYKQLKKTTPVDWLLKDGVLQDTFKAETR